MTTKLSIQQQMLSRTLIIVLVNH